VATLVAQAWLNRRMQPASAGLPARAAGSPVR
jgi:hypothetical protein